MDNNISFEKSLSELEMIVKKLEEGECSLEESINLYKNGAELCAQCSKVLENAKLTIKNLSEAEEDENV